MKPSSNNADRRSAAQMHALATVHEAIQPHGPGRASKYLREFTQAFRTYDRPLTSEELNRRITFADILLIGDYHALPQSQRFAASLIERIAGQRPIVAAVEAVLARDQRILDSWWRREVHQEELRRRLRFDREWGYEWAPFYELLTAARDHAEGIYGLDCMPREDLRRIRTRDRHAADKINDIRRQHPGAAILVLFGESHMAPEHLPRALHQVLPEENILIVLQNVDTLYWQAVEEENAAAVAIGEDTVCVFNASPLEKYESFRLCLEKWNGDDQPDFAPAVYNLIFSLARSLGFRLDSHHNRTQPRYLSDSLPEVVPLQDFNAPGVVLGEKGCAYVPETNTFLIREFEIAPTAAEAARFLHHACQGFPAEMPTKSALADALAHFGSRLLCPENRTESCSSNDDGEALYQAYVDGRISKTELRRLFLARDESPERSIEILSSLLPKDR